MQKFISQGQVVEITEDCHILELKQLNKILEDKTIREIIVRAKIDINVMYLLKSKEKEGVLVTILDDTLKQRFEKINIVTIKPIERRTLPSIGWNKAVKIFVASRKSSTRQNIFWDRTFVNVIDLCFVQNVTFFSLIMIFSGFMTIYLSRYIFVMYCIEEELAKIACTAWVDALTPILTCTMIMAKFSTAMSAMIKFKDINHELKTLRFFGLSIFSDYMNPILLGCACSSIIMQIFCIITSILGSACAWKLSGHSIYLFLNIAINSISSYSIIVSLFKVLVSSLWLGLITCLVGLNSGKSVVSIFLSVEKMVVVAFSGIVVIQVILSKILLTP